MHHVCCIFGHNSVSKVVVSKNIVQSSVIKLVCSASALEVQVRRVRGTLVEESHADALLASVHEGTEHS